MKKKFLFVVIALCIANLCHAADNISVWGDASVLYKVTTAYVQFDYTDLIIEDQPYLEYLKGRGEDFLADWPQESARAENESFIGMWNYRCKNGLQLTSSATNTEYKVFIVVKEMDMGFYNPMTIKTGGAKMTGTLYVFQGNDFDKSLLTVDFEKISGTTDLTEYFRRASLYNTLATALVKTVQKGKNLVSTTTPAVTLSTGFRNQIAAGTFGSSAVSSGTATTYIAPETSASSSDSSSAETVTVSAETPASSSEALESSSVSSASDSSWDNYSSASSSSNDSQTAASVENTSATTDWKDNVVAYSDNATAATPSQPAYTQDIPATIASATASASVGSSVDFLKGEKRISVVIDFSEAIIDDKSEEEFINYMTNYVKEKERDPNFAETWQQCIAEQFTPAFISKANDALRKKGLDLRLVAKQGSAYTLKVVVDDIELKGSNKSDYLFVETETGNVVAKFSDEVKGLPMSMGKISNMIEYCFKSAGDKFGCDVADQLAGE